MAAHHDVRSALLAPRSAESGFLVPIFQAFFEYGENGRYSIPTQQLAVAFVMLYASGLLDRRRSNRLLC
jgi:hypothetical protein